MDEIEEHGIYEAYRLICARYDLAVSALREIDNMAPATCDMTLAHQMADCARAVLKVAENG